MLAYVYIDGENFGQSLVERGLARVYDDGSFTLKDEYLAAENDAQAADERLWSYEGGATATPTATPTPAADDGGSEDGSGNFPTPSGGSDDPYDCSDFDSHDQAQRWFENHNPAEDPAGLDGDGNGEACESLP